MRQTLRRTASSVSFLLAASALALPVALARGVTEQAPVTFRSASYLLETPREPLLASSETLVPLTSFGMYVPGSTLVARLDGRASTGGGVAPAEQVTVAPSESNRYFGVDLPRPNRWSSVLATLALVGFFFLRRIV